MLDIPKAWSANSALSSSVCWTVFRHTNANPPNQGWKIHLSASTAEAVLLFDRVVPYLLSLNQNFKLPASIKDVAILNSGTVGRTQVGKVVTVYVDSYQDLESVCEILDDMWHPEKAPVILSDLALHPSSAVYLRYGAIHGAPVLRDPHGRYFYGLKNPDGILVPDRREETGNQPNWAYLNFFRSSPKAKGSSGFSLPQDLTFLATIHSSPKGSVLLTVDTDCVLKVVKVARRGVGADLRGFDAYHRLEREHQILQSLNAIGGAYPAVGSTWSDGDCFYMTLSDIQGTDISQLDRPQRLSALRNFLWAVAKLHKHGIVHRDLKLCNAIYDGSAVVLLDFELAAEIDAIDIPIGGTPGYIPPEGIEAKASPSGDVFALGACVVHALTEIDPASVVACPGRLIGLLRLYGYSYAIKAVKQALGKLPEERQTVHALATEVESWGQYTSLKTPPQRQFGELNRNRLLRKVLEAAMCVDKYRCEKNGYVFWRNTHFLSQFACEGISLGSAGIILGLTELAYVLRQNRLANDVQRAASWLASTPIDTLAHGLFTGNGAAALALYVSALRAGKAEILDAAHARFEASCLATECDLFSGKAGTIWLACLISDALASSWPLERVEELVYSLMQSSVVSQGIICWQSSGTVEPGNEPYVGAAHGAAGIAAALALWGKMRPCSAATELALEVFSSIYTNARSADGIALLARVGSELKAASGIWCHGAGGYLWCILQSLGDDPRLQTEIDWAIDALAVAAPTVDPTYCHGLAGRLEIWNMVRSIHRHRTRATREGQYCANLLGQVGRRQDGLWCWSSDRPDIVTPDLWLGFLGPAMALGNYLSTSPRHFLSRDWIRSIISLG